MLELTLDPASIAGLVAIPGLRRTGRSIPARLEWHDSPDGVLLAQNLVLCHAPPRWRLLRDGPGWAAPAVLAEARDPAALGHPLPPDLVLRAAWDGTRHGFRWTGAAGTVRLSVLDGRVNRRRGRLPPCRLSLDGSGPAVAALAAQLAEAGAQVPRASLARGAMLPPDASPPSPTPRPLQPQSPAAAALADLVGTQLDAMLHWAARIADPASGPEPVHQMRVATRRLRAVLSTFRAAAPCPELAMLADPLRHCAAQLGAARDWDVFAQGAGRRLEAAFPGDARVAAMLRAATRRRRTVYRALRAYLAGPAFRVLLALLAHAAAAAPWGAGAPGHGDVPLAVFAARRMDARRKRVLRAGRKLATLPVAALHELRKDCKKLRYTAELFSVLFASKPAKRFLRPLADLQEELGLLNDAAAVGGLMAQLGRAERGFAAGLAEGFTAAQSTPARARIARSWKHVRAARPFWPRRSDRPSSKPPKPLIPQDPD